MRVAILTTDDREHLKDYGARAPYFGKAPEALLQGFARMPEVEVHVISCAQRPMNSPAKLAGNIWFHSLHVPKVGWMRTLYQGCIRAVRGKLREIQPDIVHGQGTERDCAVSAVISGFPNVVTIHGNMVAIAEFYRARPGSFHWLAARLENFTVRRTAGVFCNSAYTEELVRPRARCVWRVPNAIRRAFVDNALMNPVCSRPPIFLNVGVIEPRKRQLELLDVVEALRRRGLKFEFQFIGRASSSDAYAVAFLERLKPMEKEGYVRYLGVHPVEELVRCFDVAAGMIHFPSEESFGLVIAEALARNLKLFATSVGGIVDIATGVEGADLFQADDWPGLENAIERWIKIGCPRPKTANESMRSRYAPDVIAQRHLEIYREVLNSSA